MAADRIVLLDVRPQVDCGRWPAKACVGDRVRVGATLARDGHDVLRAVVRFRGPRGRWREEAVELAGPDVVGGSFPVDRSGRWRFQLEAWVDRHGSWLLEYDRKRTAGQVDLSSELAEGEALFGSGSPEVWRAAAAELTAAERHGAVRSSVYEVDVERERARAGAWYELFPRSWGGLRGVAEIVPELARLGFDVIYLPPIHPIGVTNRKGRNNSEAALPGDVGSPWAIGGAAGGHDSIHPELGTRADFDALLAVAREHDLELALDLAIQFSPDHPWLTEHRDWFRRRPDGSLEYAENPPKRYQDIHNLDWDCADRKGLWKALRDVVLYWCDAGVSIFRVDNPHTKPVPFWEWLIAEVRKAHPDTVFLSESFTRPAMMTTLAKVGFSQSYTYFTWKNTRVELVELVEQLRSWSAFLRPSLWPNTPDILHEYLQHGGRPAFEARLVLAATLSSSYGIYSGFEACEHVAVREGSEEYLDSEKYEVKHRSLDGPLLPLIERLNTIRRDHPALTGTGIESVTWLDSEGPELIGYARQLDDDLILTAVNLDPVNTVEGVCVVPDELAPTGSIDLVDELTGANYRWSIGPNYVRLGPGEAHVLSVTRR